MSPAPDTRISLILRLRGLDDQQAWSEFVRLYEPVIYRVARGSGLQEADATDLTQEVFQRVATAVERWEPDRDRGSFRGWLRTITGNLMVQDLRRRRAPHATDLSRFEPCDPGPAASESDTAGLFELERQRQLFAFAAEAVRPQCSSSTWLAFWRTAVEQRTVIEVAQETGLTPGAVYVARSRVLARLRQAVEGLELSESGAIRGNQETDRYA